MAASSHQKRGNAKRNEEGRKEGTEPDLTAKNAEITKTEGAQPLHG
jgi:hypothetical protein